MKNRLDLLQILCEKVTLNRLPFALLAISLLLANGLSAQSVIPYSSYIPTAGVPTTSVGEGLKDSEFDATCSYHFGITSSTAFTTTAGAYQAL